MGEHSKASTAPKACLGLGRMEGGHGEALDIRNCREVGAGRASEPKSCSLLPSVLLPFCPRGLRAFLPAPQGGGSGQTATPAGFRP